MGIKPAFESDNFCPIGLIESDLRLKSADKTIDNYELHLLFSSKSYEKQAG